jgi:hypothetical protein
VSLLVSSCDSWIGSEPAADQSVVAVLIACMSYTSIEEAMMGSTGGGVVGVDGRRTGEFAIEDIFCVCECRELL